MIQSVTTVTTPTSPGFENPGTSGVQASKRQAGESTNKAKSTSGSLTPEEQRQVDQLKQTDQKVRAHEAAHLAVGAELVRGGASFTYETGPDKRRYAVGGEVSIDTSPGRTPEETVPKAQHIRATALAPVDPSSQDHSVAAQATRMENEARQEMAMKLSETAQGATKESTKNSAASLYHQVSSATNPVGHFLDSFA